MEVLPQQHEVKLPNHCRAVLETPTSSAGEGDTDN